MFVSKFVCVYVLVFVRVRLYVCIDKRVSTYNANMRGAPKCT